MKPIPFGLAWLHWQRHRLGLSLIAGYVLLFALTLRLLPPGPTRELTIIFSIPLMFAVPFLVSVFTHPDGDIFSGTSGYPSHLFLLPVRTHSLVLWPMLFGALSMAGAWLVFASVVLRPFIPNVPMLWPAALLAALVALVQALTWTPFHHAFLRAALALIAFPLLLRYGIYPPDSQGTEARAFLFSLAVVCLSMIAAHVGVARARRGDGNLPISRPGARKRETSLSERPAAPFASAMRAQIWFNGARTALRMPFVALVILALLTGLMVYQSQGSTQTSGAFFGPFAELQPGSYLRACLLALGLPVFLGMLMDSGASKADTRSPDLAIHVFQATRPLSTGQLVLARLASGAVSGLLTWAITLLFLALWCLLPVRLGSEQGPLGAVLLAHASPRMLASGFLLLLLLVVSTVRNQACGLFVDLTGRKWIVQGFPVVVSLFVTAGLYIGALLLPDPEHVQRAVRWLPSIAYSLAVLKSVVALVVLLALRRSRLISDSRLMVWIGVWVLSVLAVYACLRFLIPAAMLSDAHTLLAAFLWMPASRLALAPLSLHYNRHR